MLYFWWGCRGNLKLITLGNERVIRVELRPTSSGTKAPCFYVFCQVLVELELDTLFKHEGYSSTADGVVHRESNCLFSALCQLHERDLEITLWSENKRCHTFFGEVSTMRHPTLGHQSTVKSINIRTILTCTWIRVLFPRYIGFGWTCEIMAVICLLKVLINLTSEELCNEPRWYELGEHSQVCSALPLPMRRRHSIGTVQESFFTQSSKMGGEWGPRCAGRFIILTSYRAALSVTRSRNTAPRSIAYYSTV